MDLPSCMRSKPLLMSLSGRVWVMRSSMLILPSMYQSTILGTSVRPRSEEHTSELQSLMRISYAVFCLKKKKIQRHYVTNTLTLNHDNVHNKIIELTIYKNLKI